MKLPLYTLFYHAKMEGSTVWYKGEIRNLTLSQCGRYTKQLNTLFNTETFMTTIR